MSVLQSYKIQNGSSKIKTKEKLFGSSRRTKKSLTAASSDPSAEVPATLIFVISLLFGISLWLKTCAFHSFQVSQDISKILITKQKPISEE
jgi:hypothetical protein